MGQDSVKVFLNKADPRLKSFQEEEERILQLKEAAMQMCWRGRGWA